jgi:hypothetical protein
MVALILLVAAAPVGWTMSQCGETRVAQPIEPSEPPDGQGEEEPPRGPAPERPEEEQPQGPDDDTPMPTEPARALTPSRS